ncbi:subtilase, partial [Bacillus pumilus]
GLGRGTVRTPQPADGRIYNLEGQCVGTDLDTLPHGIYIVCGKKVMR